MGAEIIEAGRPIRFGPCQSFNRSSSPFGSLDAAVRNGTTLSVGGWSIDPDTANPVSVHIYVDGAVVGGATANSNRPDLGAAFPLFGPNHGYNATFTVTAAAHRVCVYAINIGAGTVNPLLSCTDVS